MAVDSDDDLENHDLLEEGKKEVVVDIDDSDRDDDWKPMISLRTG